MASPLVDLSYRGYEGIRRAPGLAWQVIARMTIRQAFKKRAFWVVTAISSWYYLSIITIVFFIQQAADAAGPAAGPAPDLFVKRLNWPEQFVHGFSFGHLFWLTLALMLGAGAIANDNKANALLVYLSKPVTKGGYLLGKFLGVWTPLTLAMFLPSFLFYLYAALNYREYGFPAGDWLLLPRIVGLCAIASAFHTSIVLGISSLFRSGAMAGATYAGIYFLGSMFRGLMGGLWTFGEQGSQSGIPSDLVGRLYYFPPDGNLLGLAKVMMNTRSGLPYGPRNPTLGLPMPTGWILLTWIVAVCALTLFLAYRKISAVEVVR